MVELARILEKADLEFVWYFSVLLSLLSFRLNCHTLEEKALKEGNQRRRCDIKLSIRFVVLD